MPDSMPPPEPPPVPPPSAVPPPPPVARQANAGMLILAYLGLLALIPLLLEKNDREVQWHAKNGLLFFGAELLLGLTLSFIGAFLHLFLFFFPLLWAGLLVLHVIAIVKALSGQRLVIPGLSEYADRF